MSTHAEHQLPAPPAHLDAASHAARAAKIFGGCLAAIVLMLLICAGILSITIPRLEPSRQFASETGIDLPADAKLLIDDYEYHTPVVAFGPGAYDGLLLYQFDVPETFAQSILIKEPWSTPWSNQKLPRSLSDIILYDSRDLHLTDGFFYTFENRDDEKFRKSNSIGNGTLLIVEPSIHRITLIRWDT